MRVGDERRFINLLGLVRKDDFLNAATGARDMATNKATTTQMLVGNIIFAEAGRWTSGDANGL